MSKNIFIFCQAPLHIPYMLTVYDMYKNSSLKITIVCPFENMKIYFDSLNLNARIIVLPKIDCSYKKFFLYYKYRRRFLKNLIEMDIYKENSIVFFSSVFHRLYNYYIKLYLELKLTEVRFIQIEKFPSMTINKITLKKRVEKLFLFLITKIKYEYTKQGDHIVLRFPLENYPIKIIDIKICNNTIEKYCYKIPTLSYDRHNVILFANPYRDPFNTEEDYIKLHKNVCEKLKDCGYNIFLKGHPRIGLLNSVTKYADNIIPDFIPSELIDYSQFSFAFGFTSTAICNLKIPAFSFLKLCQPVNLESYNYWIDYLNQWSNSKVTFIEDINEIGDIKSVYPK